MIADMSSYEGVLMLKVLAFDDFNLTQLPESPTLIDRI